MFGVCWSCRLGVEFIWVMCVLFNYVNSVELVSLVLLGLVICFLVWVCCGLLVVACDGC